MTNGLTTRRATFACWLCAAIVLHAAILSAADWPAEFLDDADLHGVIFVDAKTGWAVGDRGAVWHTRNGGREWERQSVACGSRLNAVTFVDENRGWIAGATVEPYSMNGKGSIWTTDDGGQTWTSMPRAALSYLHDLAVYNDRVAMAVGSQWPLFPSGVFHTSDGGRGWHPLSLKSDEDWVACEFNSDGEALLVGRYQTIAPVSVQRPQQGIRSATLSAQLRCGCWLDSGNAIAAGDNGTLLALVNERWLDASSSLPAGAKDQFDFHAVTAVGNRIFLAGAPGNVIWRSDDGCRSWVATKTEQSLPLRDLCFVDANHGWAVGALGVILATTDGGETWQVQRGNQRRVGALVVSLSSNDIPWTVMAHLSAEHQVRSRGLVIDTIDASNQAPFSVRLDERLALAALAVGAGGADLWTEFPAPPAIVNPNRHAIEAGWLLHQRSQELALVGTDRLKRRLICAIRQWRPDLIVLQLDPGRGDLSQLLMESVLAARDAAANPGKSGFAPPPWRVDRIVQSSHTTSTGARTVARLMPTGLSMALGSSVGELASSAATRINAIPASAEPIYLQPMFGPPVRSDLSVHFTARTETLRSASAESHSIPASGSLESLSRQIQLHENTRALLERSKADGARSLQLISQLPEDTAARLMLKIANQHYAAGDATNGKHTLMSLRLQYPQHPAAGQALWHLFSQACSEEAQVRNRSGISFKIDESNQLEDEPVVQASHVAKTLTTRSPEQWYAELPADQRNRPEWQFALSSRRSQKQSTAMMNRLKQSAPTAAWRLSAASEIWMQDRSRAAPKPAWDCRVGKRPRLDGRLDEPLWSQASGQILGTLQPMDHPLETRIWIGRDDLFLYLAVKCKKLSELTYPEPTTSGRRRDTLPGDLDRVDFYIDVNRDYLSGWRLGFDSRGWAIDSESGQLGWNPDWFVAASESAEHWTVEAAIPLGELVLDPAQLNDAWGLGVTRIVPGWGWQSWPAGAGASPRWHELGLLLQ